MLTAKEAREKINESYNIKIETEKKVVEALINYAVELGESACKYEGYMSTTTAYWLQDLGYSVKICENSFCTIIRW